MCCFCFNLSHFGAIVVVIAIFVLLLILSIEECIKENMLLVLRRSIRTASAVVSRFSRSSRASYTTDDWSLLTDFKGKEHVEEAQYIRRDEKERLHKRLVEIEADIRNILTTTGDSLTQDTVPSPNLTIISYIHCPSSILLSLLL